MRAPGTTTRQWVRLGISKAITDANRSAGDGGASPRTLSRTNRVGVIGRPGLEAVRAGDRYFRHCLRTGDDSNASTWGTRPGAARRNMP